MESARNLPQKDFSTLEAKGLADPYCVMHLMEETDEIDYSTSEVPEEHKSFNLLELDNGQYCLYPNNRMRVYDNSLTPPTPKQPDFKVSTEYYQVENGYTYRLGDTDEYFWKQSDAQD